MIIDAKILKAMADLTSKRLSRGAMTCVAVQKDGECTNFIASDEYVLAWLRVKNSVLNVHDEDGDYSYLLPATAIKSVTANKAVSVTIGNEEMIGHDKEFGELCSANHSRASENQHYMNWKQLLPKKGEDVTNLVTLNMDFIANGCKLIKTVFGKNAHAQIEVGETPYKPVRMVAANNDMQLVYLTMPIRSTDGCYTDKYKLTF